MFPNESNISYLVFSVKVISFLTFMWLDQSTFLFPLPFESNEIFNKSITLIIIQEIIGLAYVIYKMKDNSLKTFIRSGII